MSQDKGGFSRLRAYLWPIHNFELRKFLPLLVMAFFIGFNYNILRNMKDALLITAKSSGAEVIPFIKVWGIVPGALLMTFIYSAIGSSMR
jgi:AAA family ATP:ADP antiporter